MLRDASPLAWICLAVPMIEMAATNGHLDGMGWPGKILFLASLAGV